MWEKQIVNTNRGQFEQGEGEPLCITHLFNEFNELGNYLYLNTAIICPS